jgi:FAD/FMN-containing dehydrogenase/Fe-S oxidoreductase
MVTVLDRTSHLQQPNLGNLPERVRRETTAEILVDAPSRGRYATDASIYQIVPRAVAIPRREGDLAILLQIAREEGVPVLARGGGTSQSGQTVGDALVIDCSKYLRNVLEVDAEKRTALVQPGIVLDALNAEIAKTGLWFPVDVSTKARATLGGMAGNNSCGTRSIRYGVMRDNVTAIDAILADGSEARFGEIAGRPDGRNVPDAAAALMRDLVALGSREAGHLATAYPNTARRVGGYNLDALVPGVSPVNLATLLVGSEGTLALSKRIALKLSPQPRNKTLGICHFPTFRRAMEAAQHIVKLGPVAVELVDRTLIELARDIAMFRPVMEKYVRGAPDALLFVEFAEDDQAENLRRLDRLEELMGDLGLPKAVVKVTNAGEQKSIWEVREAGLNIMMSMKSDGKPVSFIEDCAVPLEHLADYTERLTAVFDKHGTKGTWYAHASVGCLHVRPVLNLKLQKDARTMRAIAEEAFALVREYKGAHSGEHGDGLVRSEFHESMYGSKTVRLFEEVKDRFDPDGVMNPGKIVRAPAMNDRTLFRYQPDYHVPAFQNALEWPDFSGAGGGFQGAVEMCNNNGACRKFDAGVMCPSYRVTRDEKDVTRGRANTLRLAISGQLGADGLGSDAMLDTMKLCVSCKGCRRECPTGVDMAKMKIEVLHARNARAGLPLRDRLIAYLPRYAPYAARVPWLMNGLSWLRDTVPGLAALSERLTGLAAKRPLPRWAKRHFASMSGTGSHTLESPPPSRGGAGVGGNQETGLTASPHPAPEGATLPVKGKVSTPRSAPETSRNFEGMGGELPYAVFAAVPSLPPVREVALLADTFNTYFEPDNLHAAIEVLERLGYHVTIATAASDNRPLCCGRTFLAAGLVDEAKSEARRTLDALEPLIERGMPVVGLEPSCLLTLRDEYLVMGLGERAEKLSKQAFLLEEFLAREIDAGQINGPIGTLNGDLRLHGHCHQKAFGIVPDIQKVLALVEGLDVKVIESSCCGMAGAFGYAAETHAASMAMGELSLLPAVRAAKPDTRIAADGFSCRHQIADGAGRNAQHVAIILRDALRTAARRKDNV